MRRYLTHFALAGLAAGLIIPAANWLIDPYWVFSGIGVHRVNQIKPAIATKQRISEIFRVRAAAPEVLILGSSREDDSIDPAHPAFLGRPAFNAAISAQPYEESRLILDALIGDGHAPQTLVAGLLFEAANTQLRLPDDFSLENFRPDHRWKLLFNVHTFSDSLLTARENLLVTGRSNQANWLSNGYLYPGDYKINQAGQRMTFVTSEKRYLRYIHWPEPGCGHELVAPQTGISRMEEIRRLFATVYRTGINGKIFIGPSHARQWETIAASGLWQAFEDWKRLLVSINEKEAARVHRSPMALWDFSGYNSVTTEDVPPGGDATTRMKYYFESSHYRPAAGNMVLDRMFGYRASDRKMPDDFGVRISSANIEAHLARIRAERERYRLTHPDDVAEIESMARQARNEKNCRKPGTAAGSPSRKAE
jgi:hypothetical protein